MLMKSRLVASVPVVGASVLGAIFLAPATFAQSSPVPFVICAESFDWTRPTPSVQARIWNDNRYKDVGPSAYEWNHDFLLNEPESASLTYHSGNLSGLWTAGPRTHCQRHDGDPEWIELWALNHHVASMTLEADVITVTAEHRDKGFEILQFQRPSSLGSAHATIRFVNARGEVLDQLVERTPLLFVPAR
jgi:hypothetical protein